MLVKIASPKLGGSAELEYNEEAWTKLSVIRCKDSRVSNNIAELMKKVSVNVTYDKENRYGLIEAGKAVDNDFYKIDLEGVGTDNAAAVRFCLLASGIEVGDFNTRVEADVLLSTTKFDVFEVVNDLKIGDILVTKTPGDTVIVVDIEQEQEKPSLARYNNDNQKNIKKLQKDLNYVLKMNLNINGNLDEATVDAINQFKGKYGLKIDGKYDADAYNKMKELLQ